MIAQFPNLSSFPDDGIAVVIGASGGIGHASVDALRASGRFKIVHALSRRSNPPIDITDETSIQAAVEWVQADDLPIRLVLDCTGFLHDRDHGGPEKSYRRLDPAHMAHAFAVNAIGPAMMMKHILPLLPRTGKAAFATLSAKVGSITDNHFGGWYSYRASKAALNQLVRTAAIELSRRQGETLCVAIHPGTTDTALSEPFSKTGLTVRSSAETATRLLNVIDRLESADSGGFFNHDGTPLPW
ncbi:SDR family NAD(P)-dependent oxidoreductase [Rhodovibrio salinarum]|uniref:SDR family oxidoreductase n=1 Tax=Rhodovibrio salinarum TaxID=1087 RepID=A0A934QK28_9PROT|nr:SDR family NAD(P)-dependent oxidoreductase [Rhodovibrio salinarum]MBK1698328.1 SDR family oxidoreductase [Rhodovibrio salinarum]